MTSGLKPFPKGQKYIFLAKNVSRISKYRLTMDLEFIIRILEKGKAMSTAPPSILKPLSAVPVLKKAATIAPKPVLTSCDIDGTLIPWTKEPEHDEVALQRYSNFAHQSEFRNNNFILLNTGRGLSSIQGIASLLKKFPIDALG